MLEQFDTKGPEPITLSPKALGFNPKPLTLNSIQALSKAPEQVLVHECCRLRSIGFNFQNWVASIGTYMPLVAFDGFCM